MKQSESLTAFYDAYLDWLNKRARSKKFSRKEGLCTNLIRFLGHEDDGKACIPEIDEIQKQFGAAGLDRVLPFNSRAEGDPGYCNETFAGKAHTNKKRVAWVKAHASTPA